MKQLKNEVAARAPSPLQTKDGREHPRPRQSSPETGFRTYRSGRQMRDAVSAVVQASRWVRHDTPGF